MAGRTPNDKLDATSTWLRFRKTAARTRNRALRAVGLLPPPPPKPTAPKPATAKPKPLPAFNVAEAFNQKKYAQVWSYGVKQTARLPRSETVMILKAGGELGAAPDVLERVAARAKAFSKDTIEPLVLDCFLRLGTGPVVAGVEAALRLLAAAPQENQAIETARYVTTRVRPGDLSDDDFTYLEAIQTWLDKNHPDAVRVVSREMAIVRMNNAETQRQGVEALENVGAWLEANGEDRGVLAFIQRFLPRHLARIQSGDAPPDRVRPLEDAERMEAYVASGGAAAIRESSWWRWQSSREKLTRGLRAATPHPRAPSSMVFLTDQDAFLGPLYDAMKARGWSVGQHRFSTVTTRYKGMMDLRYGDPRWLTAPQKYAAVFDHPLMDPILSADVVVCEFASGNAVWASHNLKPGQKLFLHLHAYEAFSVWPWMMNWGGVDGIIYVSEPVRTLMEMDLGDRIAPVPSTILPNIKALTAPAERGTPGRALGMLGTVHRVKQPHLALDILETLRQRTGEDWTLRFTGRYFPAEDDADESAYKEEFERRLADFPEGTVSVESYTSDIPDWFAQTDYLLSCSLREGTHEVVNEAMHHGVVPVVRDWPVMAPLGGPAAVYPVLRDKGLIFGTADEAVDVILRTQSEREAVLGGLAAFSGVYSDSERNASAFSDFITHRGFQ